VGTRLTALTRRFTGTPDSTELADRLDTATDDDLFEYMDTNFGR
jgi:hypothetical protein